VEISNNNNNNNNKRKKERKREICEQGNATCRVALFTDLKNMYSNFCLHNSMKCIFNLKLQIANPMRML
jgi:hypothetical protein